MALSLIGHYDSPYVRRVGISLSVLGMPFERQPLSVFGDADKLRAYNPAGRVPVLVLEDGECLVDSVAILDHLDEVAGSERALVPAGGKARRDALQIIGLAMGLNDKSVSITYEHRRVPAKVDDAWIARCRGQQDSLLEALERRVGAGALAAPRMMLPHITLASALSYLRLRQPETFPAGRYPRLQAFATEAEGLAAFQACLPSLQELGGPADEARAALLRLRGGASSA